MSQEFSAGAAVRLIHDPSRVGTLTGKKRERSGKIRYQVRFDDGTTYQPVYELELVLDDSEEDVFDLLDMGRFGRLSDLRRNLTHVQLSGRLANLVYSMDVTNTDFYAYQYKPVLSFLESPSNGILIADEVGLGKTIEAGLIWTELRSRTDARRLLVICPAMLREKWRSELDVRFGVDASIMSASELLTEVKKNKSQIPDGKGIVCSMQGLRPGRSWGLDENKKPGAQLARFLRDMSGDDPLFDLVIIDEAHYMRNPESQTAKLGALVRPLAEHIVLLSATPVNLKSDDLFHLLKLVDPTSFSHALQFPAVLGANEPLNKARDMVLAPASNWHQVKSTLEEAKTHRLLENSKQLESLLSFEPIAEELTDAERVSLGDRISRINLLRHAVTRTRKSEVHEWQVTRVPQTYFVTLSDFERKFYDAVTREIRLYAMRRDISDGFLLATPQRQISSCMYAAVRAWKSKINPNEFEEFKFEAFDGNEELTLKLSTEHTNTLTANIIKKLSAEMDLDQLKELDSKYNEFLRIIKQYLDSRATEKLVVFSFFRGTLHYLNDRLTEDGIASQVLIGGMAESKQEAINRFRETPETKVLLSSEVASEGVDLQFCQLLINYDLPWNPMKVEQRIGRIDRLGQPSPHISIWNLCYANTVDERIHSRLFERLKIFERSLGGLDAVLGEKLHELTQELFVTELTPEQESERIERIALAIERKKQESDELEKSASTLVAHSDYILRSVQAAHDFKQRITEQDLIVYVSDYLQKYAKGHLFYESDSENRKFEIQLPSKMCAELDHYCRKHNLLEQTRLATGDKCHCQFENKIRKRVGRLETVNQFHPLIRFISYDLRKQEEAFYPLVAVKVSKESMSSADPGVYAFVAKRWSFSGLRTVEELMVGLTKLSDADVVSKDDAMRLVNDARLYGHDWHEVSNEVDAERVKDALDRCDDYLESEYHRAVSIRDNENADRINLQLQMAETHFRRQIDTQESVVERHRAAGNKKILPAAEGKLKKLKSKYAVKMEQLESNKVLERSSMDVCSGLIKVV